MLANNYESEQYDVNSGVIEFRRYKHSNDATRFDISRFKYVNHFYKHAALSSSKYEVVFKVKSYNAFIYDVANLLLSFAALFYLPVFLLLQAYRLGFHIYYSTVIDEHIFRNGSLFPNHHRYMGGPVSFFETIIESIQLDTAIRKNTVYANRQTLAFILMYLSPTVTASISLLISLFSLYSLFNVEYCLPITEDNTPNDIEPPLI